MSSITVTLGNPPSLDADQRRQQAVRAREIIDGAGWAFNAYISRKTADLLNTAPDQTDVREQLYHSINAATELKAGLIQIIETQQAEDKIHERNRTADQSDAE